MAAAAAVALGCSSPRGAPPAVESPAAQAAVVDHSGGWIGKSATGFALPGVDGRIVDLGQVLGSRPVVLIFYRGNW